MKRSLILILLPLVLFATPGQVILIRHAEKPPSGNTLSLKGRERAQALSPFFQGTPAVLSYGLPAAIYAAAPSLQNPSTRCIDTVEPLAEQMNLSLNQNFTGNKTAPLVNELLSNPDYEGKMVLVCWSHEQIPNIAILLGAKKAPKKWDHDTFDRLWILTFDESGNVSFKDLPQKLMYGDDSK